ncbi:twin-arginine translocation protein TatB [Roseobacter sp. SK209-2-6]|uniref:Sec-independent protein translocase protein TatB n=1 Tax=Roseobacter sp. SK209-2-6 TaxID=388739 RepID=UPI0000F3CF7D|nr:Sec-independent protein translocase protein TatB [Roseobacter sp. SK209-2-6]EBA15260.1 twin-arginine translocation protein TatB [Roseobacter sp. SK209-2-6]
MFDLGWTELLVIGVVALIVVGPKDLPVLFRSVGRLVGKAKGMAREFSQAMNDAADESGVRDVAKGLKAATNPVGTAMDGVKEAAQDMARSIDPTKYDAGSETAKLAAERAADAKKIQAATARAAAERKAREAEEAMAHAEAAEAAVETAPTAEVGEGSETKS